MVVLLIHALSRGRPSSFSADGGLLYVGDFSSTVKVFDLRRLPPLGDGSSPLSQTISPALAIPNAPVFCGDACPVAALHRLPVPGSGGMLVSSSIGWWTPNRAALEEAPEGEDEPVACLNLHRVVTMGGGNKPANTAAAGGSSSLLSPDAHRYEISCLIVIHYHVLHRYRPRRSVGHTASHA